MASKMVGRGEQFSRRPGDRYAASVSGKTSKLFCVSGDGRTLGEVEPAELGNG